MFADFFQMASYICMQEKFKTEDERKLCCEQEGVKVSLENLMTFPWIKNKVVSGELVLYGWFFSIFDRCLKILDEETGEFKEFVV